MKQRHYNNNSVDLPVIQNQELHNELGVIVRERVDIKKNKCVIEGYKTFWLYFCHIILKTDKVFKTS